MPQPTKHFHFVQTSLGGSPIETVMPAAGKPVGTIAFDLTALAFYQVCQTTGDAHVWRGLGGSGAGWSKYVVSSQATPVTPYATITSAIAAAVADGHDETRPAVVLIMPGTYVESFSLPAGIRLQGLGGSTGGDAAFIPNDSVVITGSVTFAPAAGGESSIENLRINGQVLFGGTGQQSLALRQISVSTTAVSAVVCTNTTADCELLCSDCYFVSTNGTPANVRLILSTGARVRIVMHDCTLAADFGYAVDTNNDVVAISTSQITGSVIARVSSSISIGYSTWATSSVARPLGEATTPLASFIQVQYTSIVSGNTPVFDGAGDISIFEVQSYTPITFGSLTVDVQPLGGLQVTSNGVSIGGPKSTHAALDVQSTTQGFFPPRMTTGQKNTLGATLGGADEGLVVYDLTLHKLQVWTGAAFANVPG